VALDQVALSLTPVQIKGIHIALQAIAALNEDRARELNDVGFNKMDSTFGMELAQQASLSPRQAAVGMRMVRKYRKQYSSALYATIFGDEA